MHSRVIQLLPEHIPDMQDDKIMTEYSMEDGFVGSIADYVSNDCERVTDYAWLVERLRTSVGKTPEEWDKHITCYYAEEIKADDLASVGIATHVFHEAYIIFRPTFKRAYFEPRYKNFQELACKVTLDMFMGLGFDYNIRIAMNDKYDIYITDEDCEYNTLDNWLRMNLSETEEVKVWLGSTLDYHF